CSCAYCVVFYSLSSAPPTGSPDDARLTSYLLLHHGDGLQDSSPRHAHAGAYPATATVRLCQWKYFHGQHCLPALSWHDTLPIRDAFHLRPNGFGHIYPHAPSAVPLHQHCAPIFLPSLVPVQCYEWFGLEACPA